MAVRMNSSDMELGKAFIQKVRLDERKRIAAALLVGDFKMQPGEIREVCQLTRATYDRVRKAALGEVA